MSGGLIESKAFLGFTVEVMGQLHACLTCCGNEGLRQGMAVTRVGNFQRTISAVIGTSEIIVSFDAGKGLQHLVIGPIAATHLSPLIIVLSLTTNVNHRIDGATATKHMALRHNRRAAIQAFVAFTHINLRVFALHQHFEKSSGNVDEWINIAGTAFNQQHLVACNLSKARGERAAG